MQLHVDEREMQYLLNGEIQSNLTRQDSGILHTIVRSNEGYSVQLCCGLGPNYEVQGLTVLL